MWHSISAAVRAARLAIAAADEELGAVSDGDAIEDYEPADERIAVDHHDGAETDDDGDDGAPPDDHGAPRRKKRKKKGRD